MTSVLLSFALVVAWGSWIPVAQAVPGLRQATRTLYATTGNLVFAAIALVAGGSAGDLTLGWKQFWLPLAGGLVWTLGSVCAFRATELIGLARASGTWTPLNIIVAFVFGALLFSELAGFSAARYALLAGCLVLVLAGVFLIIGSQSAATTEPGHRPEPLVSAPAAPPAPTAALATVTALEPAPAATAATSATAATFTEATHAAHRRGLLLALGAGVLWGGYFVPAQWAHVPSQLGNFPLAIGMFAAAVVLAAREHAIVRLTPAHTAVQFGSGLLLGVGSVALLGLVPRVGTGVGFTIAQLSLLVNASAGIWFFKVPPPGSRAARIALAGIVLAGVGGTVIGALH
jgi:glucose uptake protein